MSSDHWHYRRADFTLRTFRAMVNGPNNAFTLFGPRRTGKTEWLLRDLAFTAGDTYRHRVAYASFWQTPAAPIAVLLYTFAEALKPRDFPDRIGGWLRSPPVKARIQSPSGKEELEIDFSRRDTPPEDQLLLLDQYIQRLSDPRQPTFLLFDEFQEIAGHAHGAEVMAALRTSLDRAGPGLKSVFTGSSQGGLRRVFSQKDAPFFRFATPLRLPDLDADFVAHQLGVLRKTFQRDVDAETAQAQFDAFRANPQFFQMWLTNLGLYPDLSPQEAAALTDRQLAEDLDFDNIWLGLTQKHRQLLYLLAEGNPGPFGSPGAERLAALTGGAAPSVAERQAAQRYLARNGFVDKWDGSWIIQDPAFERWILSRPSSDLV